MDLLTSREGCATHQQQPTCQQYLVRMQLQPSLCRYDLGKVLGKGQFGVTRLATDKKTGEVLACKSISKRKLTTPDDIADVQREVQIMHHLAGHQNVVNMRDAYEDKHHVHIVMEVCQGGELFDRIVEKVSAPCSWNTPVLSSLACWFRADKSIDY